MNRQRSVLSSSLTLGRTGEAMIREADVRAKLAEVASGAMSLGVFLGWLADNSWGMHRDSSQGAIELVSSIHDLLAERDAGAIDAAGLRSALEALRSQPPVEAVHAHSSAIESERPQMHLDSNAQVSKSSVRPIPKQILYPPHHAKAPEWWAPLEALRPQLVVSA